VVATDVGGSRDAVLDGQTGFLVRQRTPEAFAQPLIDLLENTDLRMRMRANARPDAWPILRWARPSAIWKTIILLWPVPRVDPTAHSDLRMTGD